MRDKSGYTLVVNVWTGMTVTWLGPRLAELPRAERAKVIQAVTKGQPTAIQSSTLREAGVQYAHRLRGVTIAALVGSAIAIPFDIYRTVSHPVAWDYAALIWLVLIPLFIFQLVRIRRFLYPPSG